MSKNKLVAITLAVIVSGVLLVGVSSCGREEVVYQQQTPVAQPVYVQHNGQWMEYAMFIMMMDRLGRPYDLRNYNYSTRTGGVYKPYRPSSNDYTSMKNKKFSGQTMVARPPVAVKQKTSMFGKKTTVPMASKTVTTPTKKGFFGGLKSTATKSTPVKSVSSPTPVKSTSAPRASSSVGKTSSFGGSSTRASSGGFGG